MPTQDDPIVIGELPGGGTPDPGSDDARKARIFRNRATQDKARNKTGTF